jgi:hypothetical protein
MDAATWHTSTDPIPMLSFVRPRTPWPQRRLFVVAAWNLVRHQLTRVSQIQLDLLESSSADTFDAVRQHVYDMADALEECGCTAAGALGHLRADGPHVRECWVLDAVLLLPHPDTSSPPTNESRSLSGTQVATCTTMPNQSGL